MKKESEKPKDINNKSYTLSNPSNSHTGEEEKLEVEHNKILQQGEDLSELPERIQKYLHQVNFKYKQCMKNLETTHKSEGKKSSGSLVSIHITIKKQNNIGKKEDREEESRRI